MGKVIVVGIGPGSYEDMTIRADRALQSCDAIVGYGVYVDLVKERYLDKAFYETPMTQEAKRCARQGKLSAWSAPATAAFTAWRRSCTNCAARAKSLRSRSSPA